MEITIYREQEDDTELEITVEVVCEDGSPGFGCLSPPEGTQVSIESATGADGSNIELTGPEVESVEWKAIDHWDNLSEQDKRCGGLEPFDYAEDR
jgi:hypothetical protein